MPHERNFRIKSLRLHVEVLVLFYASCMWVCSEYENTNVGLYRCYCMGIRNLHSSEKAQHIFYM